MGSGAVVALGERRRGSGWLPSMSCPASSGLSGEDGIEHVGDEPLAGLGQANYGELRYHFT